MEDHEPQPRHSGLRPPTGPPTVTAVGFSPEPDGDGLMRWLENRIQHLRDQVSESNTQRLEAEQLFAILGFEASRRPAPEYVLAQREYFSRVRKEVEEQLELERVVQRSPRADRLPGNSDTGLIEVHERTLVAIDSMLDALDMLIVLTDFNGGMKGSGQ